VPAELLGLPGGALRDHDVDEGGTAVVHRLIEGAANILRVLDKEALAAEGFHHPVIARAVDQRVGLHVEHRVFRDLGRAGADAAIVEDDNFDREVVADQGLHLHAGEADRRVAGEGITVTVYLSCIGRSRPFGAACRQPIGSASGTAEAFWRSPARTRR
jgi:hypothetical protein